MTPKNAVAGFKATSIFPCDPLKYPTERFDKRLMKKFDAWIKASKPEKRDYVLEETVAETMETVEEMQNELLHQVLHPSCHLNSIYHLHQHQPFISPHQCSQMVHLLSSQVILVIPPLPYQAPPGFRWRCKLELERISRSCTTCTNNKCKL